MSLSEVLFDRCIQQIGEKSDPLKPHQVEGIRWMLERETANSCSATGGIVADEMGLGKTYMVISYIILSVVRARSEGVTSATSTLIVVPKILYSQWKSELYNRARIVVGDMYFTDPMEGAEGGSGVVLTTYGIFSRYPSRFCDRAWGRVIFDEGHCLRNPKTKLHAAVVRLNRARPAARPMWFITGTPTVNHLYDVYVLMCLIENRFVLYTNPHAKSFGRMKPKIAAQFLGMSIARKLADYVELPPKNVHLVKVDACEERIHGCFVDMLARPDNRIGMLMGAPTPKGEGAAGAALAKTFAYSLKSNRVLAIMNYAQMACVMPSILENKIDVSGAAEAEPTIEKSDIEETDRMVKSSFETQYKIHKIIFDIVSSRERTAARKKLVFIKYKKESDYLRRVLADRGFTVEVIDGRTSRPARERILAAAPEILIVNIVCAACGLNLVDYKEVYYSCNMWNTMEEAQSEARVYRIGQTEPVDIYKYYMDGSFDVYMMNLRKWKADSTEKVLFGGGAATTNV